MTETKPTAKMRHCWFCGDELGVIEARHYDRSDTCGKLECNRAARDAEREDREESHRDLDERMGWHL